MTWEPIKPSYAVAQEAYQVLLELHRQHPEDEYLFDCLQKAERMRDAVWAEERGAL